MPAGVSVETFTLSARNMMWPPICTPVVADVALAPLAVGEVPVAWRAFVAVLTKDWLERKKTSSLTFALFKSSRWSRDL